LCAREKRGKYHCSGHDVDLALLEGLFSVFDELVAEHGKDAGERFDEGETHIRMEFGVPRLEIFLLWVMREIWEGWEMTDLEEVVEFTCDLDASGTAAYDDLGGDEERGGGGEWMYHVEQATLFFLAGAREGGSFDAVQEASLHLGWCERGEYGERGADLFGICNLLHEAGMFPYARDTECLCFGTDGVHEIVIVYGAGWLEGTEGGRVWEKVRRKREERKREYL